MNINKLKNALIRCTTNPALHDPDKLFDMTDLNFGSVKLLLSCAIDSNCLRSEKNSRSAAFSIMYERLVSKGLTLPLAEAQKKDCVLTEAGIAHCDKVADAITEIYRFRPFRRPTVRRPSHANPNEIFIKRKIQGE